MDHLAALRAFTRVVDEGGFAAASRALHLAPAAVTRRVADLEHHLGARLLNRSTRRVSLTPIGERYLEHARAIVERVAEADAAAAETHRAPRGHVRVAAAAGFATHQLVRSLARFRARYPEVTVELSACGPQETLDPAHDLTLAVTRAPLHGDFIARRLARAEVVLVAAPSYLAQRGRPSHPDELAQHEVLVPPLPAVRRSVSFRRRHGAREEASVGAPAQPALVTPSSELNLHGALAGLGIAGLPSFMAAQALAAGTLERVLPDWHLFDLEVWACLPSRKHLPPATRALMDFLVGEFAAGDRDPWLNAA